MTSHGSTHSGMDASAAPTPSASHRARIASRVPSARMESMITLTDCTSREPRGRPHAHRVQGTSHASARRDSVRALTGMMAPCP